MHYYIIDMQSNQLELFYARSKPLVMTSQEVNQRNSELELIKKIIDTMPGEAMRHKESAKL